MAISKRSAYYPACDSGTQGGLDRPEVSPSPPYPRTHSSQGVAQFVFLLGFVVTQGFLIPVFSLPTNWAVWPSLPDMFGVALVLSVLCSRYRLQRSGIDRQVLRATVWMAVVFGLNLALVTIPASETGEGTKFGTFSVILVLKYVAVCWAVSHVPVDGGRVRALHVAAVCAFLWIGLTVIGDKIELIEIDHFTEHLPRIDAGYWSAPNISSTVSPRHGMTTVVILLLGALAVATARYRRAWVLETVVFLVGTASIFLSGGRQGLLRMLAFAAVYLLGKPRKFIPVLLMTLLAVTAALLLTDPGSLLSTSEAQNALERQLMLLDNPLSNEGLSGRPDLWRSVVQSLDADPIRWIVGYGIGNYVEHRNAAHNMVLQLLQDGGLLVLILVSAIWVGLFRRIWAVRWRSWAMVALTAGMCTSVMTSGIFYPNLSTGWYLGFYFVALQLSLRPGRDGDDSSVSRSIGPASG